jgi:hypothetical protein
VIVGAPAQLTFNLQPGNSTSRQCLNGPPVVYVLDQAGNLVTGDNNTVVTLSLDNPPAGAGTLKGNLSVKAFGGIARFEEVMIDQGAAVLTYQLKATAPVPDPTQPGQTREATVSSNTCPAPSASARSRRVPWRRTRRSASWFSCPASTASRTTPTT